MACPTCDGTMQLVFGADRVWWCPRCGTLKQQGTHYDEVSAPALVGRCRRFRDEVRLDQHGEWAVWRRLGIAESIDVPADRKPPPEG